MPPCLRLAWCHLCFWSLPWGDAIAKTFKASEMFCSPYGGSCLQMCVLCWLGSVPSFSPCPCRPWKDAITESLATVAWAPLLGFVQANKRWLAANPRRWVPLSFRLRQFSTDRFDRSGYAMTAGWHGARWLARSGWHREREKSENGQNAGFSADIFLRTINGHHGVRPYSFIISSISLFNILLRFSSLIYIWVILCLLASCSLLCSAVLWYFRHLPFLCPFCCSFRPIVPVPRWHHGSSMEVCFPSSSILILLAPSPMPMPAPAQVLTGWHCANLPPPSLSFVAHPSVALPPVSTFPSLSLPVISFIHFLNHLPSLCAWNTAFVYTHNIT